jgi:hypothetical protein
LRIFTVDDHPRKIIHHGRQYCFQLPKMHTPQSQTIPAGISFEGDSLQKIEEISSVQHVTIATRQMRGFESRHKPSIPQPSGSPTSRAGFESNCLPKQLLAEPFA